MELFLLGAILLYSIVSILLKLCKDSGALRVRVTHQRIDRRPY